VAPALMSSLVVNKTNGSIQVIVVKQNFQIKFNSMLITHCYSDKQEATWYAYDFMSDRPHMKHLKARFASKIAAQEFFAAFSQVCTVIGYMRGHSGVAQGHEHLAQERKILGPRPSHADRRL